MKRSLLLAVPIAAAIVFALAKAGHEFPVYPSYYPHQIRIETIAPDRAPELLRSSKIHAYVGHDLSIDDARPESIGSVESLGSFVLLRVNPASPLAKDDASSCALAQTLLHEMAARAKSVRMHPYPITPYHGDYLYHADLADAAEKRFLDAPSSVSHPLARQPRVRATGSLVGGLVRRAWTTRGTDWDAALEEAPAAGLVGNALTQLNGWLGPPWVRTGWFQAVQLLAPASDDSPEHERVQADLHRLETRAYANPVERINLERELVTLLTAGCRAMVAGYTVKREYLSIEYSAGVENIGFDSLTGLNSPIFLRTVKLKDFPWNGWLSLGIDAQPSAAWNPVAGFNDDFGRLMWSAIGDPALLPSPNEAGWMLNRVSDVQATPQP
ncbi:MAG TPA: hypothetical protein VLQ46_10810 [Casimicrobiaceae bacterium]|nr:hypothetical protein [Casimicrobiaceae bacterium]